jgi:hypothetical protein
MNREPFMNHDQFVTLLLVILGFVLALALFVAGTLWKTRASPKPMSRILTTATTASGGLSDRKTSS